LPGEKLIMK